MNTLKLVTEGACHILATRRFEASPEAVYGAHTHPELIRLWMLGPPGWTMPECSIDPVPGGPFRYVWERDDGSRFAITGTILEVESGRRIVHEERMALGGNSVEYRVEALFDPEGSGTLLRLRLTFPDEATRTSMLETGMEQGMEASYQRIDPLLDAATP